MGGGGGGNKYTKRNQVQGFCKQGGQRPGKVEMSRNFEAGQNSQGILLKSKSQGKGRDFFIIKYDL